MLNGITLLKSKNVGDFQIKILSVNSNPDTASLLFWSKSFNKEIYNSGMMQKQKAMILYSNLNSEPKIKNYLNSKIKLAKSRMFRPRL